MRRLLLLFLLATMSSGTTPDFPTIQNNVIAQFAKIEDYQVDVKIAVKMTAFRMPKKKIHIYYKKPDKIKLESKGFAIVPKTGLGGDPGEFFNMLNDITEVSAINLNDKQYFRITGRVEQDSLDIPMSKSKGDILNLNMDVYVDAQTWTLDKVDIFLNGETVLTLNTSYVVVDGIYLPERTELKLGIKGMDRFKPQDPVDIGPTEEIDNIESLMKDSGFDPEKGEIAGEIIMDFSKYKVNKGLDDSIFN